jgi:hypothetical protein
VGSTEPCTGPALTEIGGTTPDSAELEIETETGLEEPEDSLLSEDSVEELDLLWPSEISMPSRPDARALSAAAAKWAQLASAQSPRASNKHSRRREGRCVARALIAAGTSRCRGD